MRVLTLRVHPGSFIFPAHVEIPVVYYVFFFQAEDGIRDADVTGVQTCALPIFRPVAQLRVLGEPTMTHARVLLAAGVSLALAAACHQDELFSPRVPPYAGGAMFQRYVSMGNSFTMGIQSGGINDSTQRVAYPVLVAGAMSGDPFYYPSLTIPGCPPPYTNIFTGARVGIGSTGTTCLFRSPSIPPYLSNVAVSGAWAIDLSTNGPIPGTHSNALTQLVLGGRTQLQAMMAARPTFVSVWIGDNDLVQAAFANDTTLLTDTTTFKAQYRQVLDSIQAVGAQALLIGVGEGTLPTTIPPFFSRGSTYYLF